MNANRKATLAGDLAQHPQSQLKFIRVHPPLTRDFLCGLTIPDAANGDHRNFTRLLGGVAEAVMGLPIPQSPRHAA